MSQAVRTLAEADVYVRRYTSRKQRRRFVRNVLLFIVAVITFIFFWSTRDNWPMARFVPNDAAFQLCATDLLLNRKEIAASRVWDLAPKESGAPEIRAALAGNFGMPEWVINNLISGLGLVSGPDVRDPASAVFVTRISRIGCVLEKLLALTDAVTEDYAGGLRIRGIADTNVYYAIRGRILVASQSREALVSALTIYENEALSNEDLEAIQHAATGRNLLASLRLKADDPLGAQFERVDMTFALTGDALQLDCKGVPREAFAPTLASIFNSEELPALQPPVQGLVELTADFGRPFTEVWSALLLAFPEDPAIQAVRGWFQTIAQGAGSRAPMLEKAAASLGSGFTLSWTGIDPLEVVPAPQLIARINAPKSAGYDVLLRAGLSRAPEADESAMKPYYDEAARLAIYPALGGPALHPCIAFKDDKILLASSATLARGFLAGSVPLVEDAAKGHVLVRARVAPAVAAAFEAGQELAHGGFIKGFDAGTFSAFADMWKERAALAGDLTGLLAYTNGALQFRLTLSMAPPAPAPAAPPAGDAPPAAPAPATPATGE
jgi:hypothetical protein